MSFILDALKKSETERQEQGAAEFSRVPASAGHANPARWLWLLAALLLVNFAVLLAVLLRPDADDAAGTPPATAATAASIAAPPAPVAGESTASFADQVASAVREQPATASPTVSLPEPEPVAAAAAPRSAATRNSVPTLEQLRLGGAISVAELHLDIHVFSEDPAARFVFINMDKHREGSRIDEGPVVQEITPDGVILEYQGQEFLLPRQ